MRACPSGSFAAALMSTPIRAICPRCCAHVAIGHMTVVLLRSVMNSRRLIAAPKADRAIVTVKSSGREG